MRKTLVASLCGFALLSGTSVGAAAAGAVEPSGVEVASPSRDTVTELPRTGVTAIDVTRRVVTLVDGRQLRFDANDVLTLALAYMSPENVQFTTPVTRFDPMPTWYATLEGSHHAAVREVSALRLTVVSEPTSQAKVRCYMVSGDAFGGACARPDGTTSVAWTGTRAGVIRQR